MNSDYESLVKKRKIATTVCFDAEDYEFLKRYSKAKGLSLGDLTRLLMKEILEQKRKQIG